MNTIPLAILSVSELSISLKNSIERQFANLRVRGELSEVKRAPSGHVYATLKDKDAVLSIIMWRNTAQMFQAQMIEGAEVILTGRLTTYPARSNYQLIAERLEIAGEGALLKLIEDRRKKLAAEGLFDEARKKKLPRFPARIAVITSPTGAVIRDILHRLAERYPCAVDVWPVLVQGDGAAQQITAALRTINALGQEDAPDLIIVARGGGSLEDLMAFNDEAMVRAVADSIIPVISAVGHETDTTLIDWAADKRAPTPTAAAEFATPDRLSLLAWLNSAGQRLDTALHNKADLAAQKMDHVLMRLSAVIAQSIDRRRAKLSSFVLRNPQQILEMKTQHLAMTIARACTAMDNALDRRAQTVAALLRVLKTMSFESTLERGFVMVMGDKNKPVTKPDFMQSGDKVILQFAHKKTKEAVIS